MSTLIKFRRPLLSLLSCRPRLESHSQSQALLSSTASLLSVPSQSQSRSLLLSLLFLGRSFHPGNPCFDIAHRESVPPDQYWPRMTKLSVNNEETDCEYDSDYGEYFYYSDDENTGSEWDSDYEDYKPEVQSIPVLPEIPYSKFDSTVTSIENATGKAESTGPFFWITASDLMRHCARSCGGDAYENVQEGIRQFELHKTWKYWLCYFCNEKFIDPDSHMAHLENEHQISIPHVEYQLIPALANSGEET